MSRHNPWWVIWLLTGVSVIGCNSLALSPILSDISLAFGQTPDQVARATAAYGGATALASFFLARYSENFGMRKMLKTGCIGLVIGVGSCGLAQNWIMLTVSQALAGVSAGIMLPAIYAMAASIAPPGKESQYVGRVITGWSLAMVVGIPFAALISDLWGWRMAYVVMAAFAFTAFLGFRQLPPYKREIHSAALSATQVLKIPTVLPVLSVCLLFMFSFYGVYVFMGDFARETLGISASAAGLLVMAYGSGFALASIGDSIIDRFRPQRMIRYVLLVIACLYLSMQLFISGLVPLLLICFAWGFVNHFGLNCILVILNTADPDNKGAIMGIYTATTYLATMLATLVFGYLYIHFPFTSLTTLAMASCLLGATLAAMSRSLARG